MTEDSPLERLFHEALAIADAVERNAFLDKECASQPSLRSEVDRMLAIQPDVTGFLEPERTAPAVDASDVAGCVIAGRYRLRERIGEGGMGSVWLADQSEPVKRRVAVKLIKAGMDSKQVQTRFEAERQALALMDHPNIAKVLDGGVHDRRPFFVMELVKGVPITDFCDAHRLTPRQRLELFVPVCQAIQHAHQKGIIHRDIKPSNVLVALYDDRPVPKVIDFGVAKATGGALTEATMDTGFGGVVGTPQYMSPEQATFNNLDIDTRSDVYALGILLYELLTGTPPFTKQELEKKGLLEMLRVVREEEPPRPSTRLSTADALPSLSANRGTEPRRLAGLLRNELDWIVMKALEKDRSRRYETANGFAADIQRHLAGEPVQAHPPSAAYRLRKFAARHRRGFAVAAAMAVLTLALLALAADQWIKSRKNWNMALQSEKKALLTLEQWQAEAVKARAAETAANRERMLAQEQASIAKGVSDFLIEDLLHQADPYRRTGGEAGGFRDMSIFMAVRNASQRLEGKFAGQPLTEAAVLQAMGESLMIVGSPADAAALLERSQRIRLERLGPEDRDTLAAQMSWGRAVSWAGRTAEARVILEAAYARARKQYGESDELCYQARVSLAYILGKLNDKAGSLEHMLAVDRMVNAVPNPNGRRQLESIMSLFIHFENAGDHARCDALFERARRVAEFTDAQHRSFFETIRYFQALRLAKIGRHAEAEKHYLELRAQVPADVPTTDLDCEIATLLFKSRQYERTVEWNRKLLPAMRHHSSEYQRRIAEQQLALSLFHLGRFDDAASYLPALVDWAERSYPKPNNQDFKHDCLLKLAICQDRTGESGKADVTWSRLTASVAAHNTPPAGFATLLAARADSLAESREYIRAERLFRECLVIRQRELPGRWETANTQSRLGGVLHPLKRTDEAEELLLAGANGLLECRETAPTNAIPLALDRLIRFYADTGRSDKAEPWRLLRKHHRETAPRPSPVK